MTELLMRSGRVFDVANPREEDVCLSDIACGLAAIVRFRGALGVPYTVAQHSVLLSHWAGLTEDDRRWALLHDAPEAYLGDLPSPVKRIPAIRAAYEPVERQVMATIAWRYGLPGTDGIVPAAVKQADARIMTVEVELMRDNAAWDDMAAADPQRWERWWGPYDNQIHPRWATERWAWTHDEAEAFWLARAVELRIGTP